MALKKIMIILVAFVCVLSIGLCSCQTDPLTQQPITSDTETKDVLETTGDSETSRPTGSKGVIPLRYLVEEELPHSSSTEYAVMTFGPNGSGDIVFSDDLTYGNAKLTEENTIKIAYSKRTNLYVYYMAKIKFNVGDYASTSLRYVRVLYRAKNPEGTDSVSMLIENDSSGRRYMLQESVVDTNGEYVLSDTALLPFDMLDRFMTKLHNSIILNPKGNDGEYEIKAVYFFASRKSADNFSPTSGNHTITINGNDIAKYQIVIDDEATVNIVTYAQKLAAHTLELNNQKTHDCIDSVGRFFWRNKDGIMSNDYAKVFARGEALFMVNRIFLSDWDELREMEDQYAIIPVPKYDETSEGYHCVVEKLVQWGVVPVTAKRTEMISAVAELMAYEGYKNVTPAYYETTLKIKRLTDEEEIESAKKVIDIICRGARTDFMYINELNGMENIFTYVCNEYQNKFASLYAEHEVPAEMKLSELIERDMELQQGR